MSLKQLEGYAKSLELLNKRFSPHPGQLKPGQALFYEGKKRIFLCLGRRFGKSTLMAYFAVRWALTKPNSPCYLIGPYQKQAREIYLHAGNLINLCPRELVESINLTEGRVTFKNGSFVRVLGADDPDSLRGLRASIICADEIKDFRPEVLDVLTPCLIDEDGPLVLSGTPPEIAEHYFWELVNTAKTDPDWAYFHGTSYQNPFLKKEVIDKERAKLEARGDADVFAREYLAEFVPGGKRAVFPMLNAEHIVPYSQLWSRIYKNIHQWQFYVTADPGTASTFAVTLGAINPYKGDVFIMDEVYVTQQTENTIGMIWPRVMKAMKEIYDPDPDDEQWLVTVDEAASWARNEILDQFDVPSFPTRKASQRKAEGISLIKDLLLKKKMLFSDRCVETVKEMRSYMLDKRGNFVKSRDHAIDTLRYKLAAANYTVQESDPPPEKQPVPADERKRAYTPHEDVMASLSPAREMYLSELLDMEE
jgi:hypothetical protein